MYWEKVYSHGIKTVQSNDSSNKYTIVTAWIKKLSEERVNIFIGIITWIYNFFTRNNPFFYEIQIFIWMKTGHIMLDFDVILPMQSTEFIKSLNFGNNLKKKLQKKHLKCLSFNLKIDLYRWENIF